MKSMKCQQRELVKQGLLLQDADTAYGILYWYNLEAANENGTTFLHRNKILCAHIKKIAIIKYVFRSGFFSRLRTIENK